MSRIIGIDLGTTNSLAAFWERGEVRLIPNALGNYLTPSVVSVDKHGNVYVGEAARERLVTQPDRTVAVFKRSMGTARTYQLGGHWYRPEELSALVLRRLKEDAEAYLGESVEEAIISVPAYFGDEARRATRDAGCLAGLRVERILNEPSAAALTCQHMQKQEYVKILVYDLGGGTLDVSLVSCFDNVVEILSVSGDTHLGGSDFDRVIAEAFCRNHGNDFSALSRGMQQALLRSAEAVKRRLSVSDKAVMAVATEEMTDAMELTRKQLISLSGKLLKRLSAPINNVLRDTNTLPSEIDQVVLVGGSTKMPLVQQYLRYVLRGVSIITANPDYMVALGTGIYAGMKERDETVRDFVMTDICPFSLGTVIANHAEPNRPYMSVIIPRNSSLPISREQTYSSAYSGQREILLGFYQGEDIYAENNTKLGELRMRIPLSHKGESVVTIRFTYDINGLLVVNIHVIPTGEEREISFLNGKLADPNNEEVMRRRQELLALMPNPRSEERAELLLARAQRLYQQSNGTARELLSGLIRRLGDARSSARLSDIAEAAHELEKCIRAMEEELSDRIEGDVTAEDLISWLEGGEEEDMLSDDWMDIL